ncbi:MAG: glycosyltransferase [Chitinophagaceae bacterium]|nr:glycosyltransferase [Chitinophagaceae bacterium]
MSRFLRELEIPEKPERYILYQGAVNEGRSFDTLIPAMLDVPARLLIAGDGNYMERVRVLIKNHGLEEKVILLGRVTPKELRDITRKAWAGVTLFEYKGKSNYFSLANRYFDYMHAGIPQLCVDYPVYRELNNSGAVALLTSDLQPASLAAGLNRLLTDQALYKSLQTNCLSKRNVLNWQTEEKTLLKIYQHLFES